MVREDFRQRWRHIKLAQLRWTGHVTRMHDERLLKKQRLSKWQEETLQRYPRSLSGGL